MTKLVKIRGKDWKFCGKIHDIILIKFNTPKPQNDVNVSLYGNFLRMSSASGIQIESIWAYSEKFSDEFERIVCLLCQVNLKVIDHQVCGKDASAERNFEREE